MTQRQLVLLIVASLAVGAGTAVLAQQNFDTVEVKPQKVAEGVWMLQGAGGNIGVSAGADGVVLIDDQFAPLTAKIKAAVATFSDQPVRFVFNTHCHGDHVGGNENFATGGAVIVAHDNVRRRMSVEQVNKLFNRTTPAAPAKALPVVTFDDSVTFHLNGETLAAFHVAPAHTDGDAVVRFRNADVVHMGDVFFNGRYPIIDLSSGGSADGIVAACDRVLPTLGPATKVIPGHGPLSDREGLKRYRDMVATVRDRVKKLVKEKKTLEQVQAAKPTAEFEAEWGAGSMKGDRFVEVLYTDYSR